MHENTKGLAGKVEIGERGDSPSCCSLVERERPLWMRRLNRVMRGFRKKDILKARPMLAGTDECDVTAVTDQIERILWRMPYNALPNAKGNGGVTVSGERAVFERLTQTVGALQDGATDALTLLSIMLLSAILNALLYGKALNRRTKIDADIDEETVTLRIKPEKIIDRRREPSVCSIVLARTLGVLLSIELDNEGQPYYKLIASRKCEYLYDVHRHPEILHGFAVPDNASEKNDIEN